MGLFLVLIGSAFIAGIFMTILNGDEETAIAIFILPAIIGLFSLLGILAVSSKKFEKQKFTRTDVTVEVVFLKNSMGKIDPVFYDEEYYKNLADALFDETQVVGDKILVRKIVRFTPRNFWLFKSSSTKYILILPDTQQ